MTDMIFTGVFERFPELQVCWIETGVGWIPHLLECLDDRWWRNRVWGDLPTHRTRRRSTGTATTRRRSSSTTRVSSCATASGVDNIMWSSDYPHHGNDWPYSRRTIEDMMGSIPEDERSRIAGGNAERGSRASTLGNELRSRSLGAASVGAAPRSVFECQALQRALVHVVEELVDRRASGAACSP